MLGLIMFVVILVIVLRQLRGLSLPLINIIAGVFFMTVMPYLFGIMTGAGV